MLEMSILTRKSSYRDASTGNEDAQRKLIGGQNRRRG